MPPSLLNQLPDIVDRAARCARETLSALDGRSTRVKRVPGGCSPVACPALDARSDARCWVGRDIPTLLDLLTGVGQQPSLKGRVGFVWLATEAKQGHGRSDGLWRHSSDLPWRAEDTPVSAQRTLSHLALRLFIARELVEPSALIAVTPVPGMGDCIALLMEAVFGRRPAWTLHETHEPRQPLLVCRNRTGCHAAIGRHRRHIPGSPTLSELLAETKTEGLTALAMRAGRNVLPLLGAWEGEWIVVDPDPLAVALLRAQVGQRQLALHTAQMARGHAL